MDIKDIKQELIDLIIKQQEKGNIHQERFNEYKNIINDIDNDNTSTYLRNKQIKKSIEDGTITLDEYKKIAFYFIEEFKKDFLLLDKCFHKCLKDGFSPHKSKMHKILAQTIKDQAQKMLGENIEP